MFIMICYNICKTIWYLWINNLINLNQVQRLVSTKGMICCSRLSNLPRKINILSQKLIVCLNNYTISLPSRISTRKNINNLRVSPPIYIYLNKLKLIIAPQSPSSQASNWFKSNILLKKLMANVKGLAMTKTKK